ncbi:MAG: hypothetical protein KDE56_23965, partial [Anaerolineales bacterium]|nr:hypothetical protein [Anaerolineales bacterium]
ACGVLGAHLAVGPWCCPGGGGGVAAHYATKKGLPKPEVEAVLTLLLTVAGSSDYQVQRGVGWGLKTIAKFYPDLMKTYLVRLPPGGVSQPVMGKIETGLKTAVFKQTAAKS